MLLRQPAKLLRFYCSGQDVCDGSPLHEAVVSKCQSLGIAGVTVFQGMEGYGESAEIHRSRILAHDQPIVVTVVDAAENIERLMSEIASMAGVGVIAVSDVEMIRIEGRSGGSAKSE